MWEGGRRGNREEKTEKRNQGWGGIENRIGRPRGVRGGGRRPKRGK